MGGLIRNRGTSPRLETNEPASNGAARYTPGQTAVTVNPPSTSYQNAVTPLQSVDEPQVSYADPHNAGIVTRAFRRNGIDNHYVYGGEKQTALPLPTSPVSSRYQQTLVRLWPWTINRAWYAAGYPGATVMNGGKHNLGLAEKTPQINTRITGGPGQAQMTRAPRFGRVQNVPRFSTAPGTYDTQGTKT
jgi:hypothetical protein